MPFKVTFLWSAGRSWIGPAQRKKGKARVGKAADANLFPCSFSIAINTEESYSKWCILSECFQCCLPWCFSCTYIQVWVSAGVFIFLWNKALVLLFRRICNSGLWQLFPVCIASVWRLWFQVALGNNRYSKGQDFSLLSLLVARAHSLSF